MWSLRHQKSKFGKTAPVNIPQQLKLEHFDSIEEDCTGGYYSDGELGPLFDSNEEEYEQEFYEDSMQLYQTVLVEEDKGELTTSIPEDETTCLFPIEYSVLVTMKVSDIR